MTDSISNILPSLEVCTWPQFRPEHAEIIRKRHGY